MRLVVADTGPLNYLVLTGYERVLPALFETALIPSIVRDELRHAEAPEPVRGWIAEPPSWLKIVSDDHANDPELSHLDAGERAAILLAIRQS